MAELKTRKNRASVKSFIKSVENPQRREDCEKVVALMKKLGKHKIGKSCLYINKLADIHLPTLKTLISRSVAAMRKKVQHQRRVNPGAPDDPD